MDSFSLLSGNDLIRKGLVDLSSGTASIEALLVSIGAHRIRVSGIAVPNPLPEADHRLYQLLAKEYGDDAHSRYNGYLRTLVSFEHALECAVAEGKCEDKRRAGKPGSFHSSPTTFMPRRSPR
jgi:hypothetical protein